MTRNQTKQGSIKLADGSVLDPFVEKLLNQRGIQGEKDICDFLDPKLRNIPNPFLLKDMEVAVGIIEEAIQENHPILIWGDYDVDGTTATALLMLFFESIGCKASYYIPNRLTEGYGLQKEPLERITTSGKTEKKVLITVDNGISAGEAIKAANDLGYHTIVTDHHTPPPERVTAQAVINPKQATCAFPEKDLAGVGLAFYLAMGLRSHLQKQGFFKENDRIPNLKNLLDLVAVGTVADMVPLGGVNRILVRAGMETLATESNLGLNALCRKTGIDPGCIRSEDISFQLAPKINAAGRLGEADKAMCLFLSASKPDASTLAKGLIDNNERRRNLNINDFADAQHEVTLSKSVNSSATIVSGNYHIGVAGIVASNLVEKYQKPSVVLCLLDNGVLKGSARSVEGVDLYKVLDECKSSLLGFGGHKMAGGMSLHQKDLEIFKELFEAAVYKQNQGIPFKSTQKADADIAIENLFNHKVLRQLHLLEPFGPGNPQPIFRDTATRFKEISPIGKDKSHLRLTFNCSKKDIKGIAFGFGSQAGNCRTKTERAVMYTPSLNFFRGKRSWQVRVTDIIFDKM